MSTPRADRGPVAAVVSPDPLAIVGGGTAAGAGVPSAFPRAWAEAAEALLAAMDGEVRPVRRPAGTTGVQADDGNAVGDPDALLAELFERESVALVRLARLFTDDRNAAEDLVQEAFVRLHRAAHRIHDRTRATAYLRSILLNLARDHNRRGLMSLRHFEASTVPATPESPDDRVVLDERQALVVEALQALAPQQRDCLVLRFYLELSEPEVADTLEISPSSVATHCRRGLDQLRLRLEGRT